MGYYDLAKTSRAPLSDSPIYIRAKQRGSSYTEHTLIAEGGMKQIYKVFDTKLARYIALAKLKPQAPEILYEAFLREAALTAKLEHPNIIKVLDFGVESQGIPFFTMELKTGKGLHEILSYHNTQELTPHHKKRNSREELLRYLHIFLRICDGMSYAHSRKVLHLDLKPSNIQIGPFGEVIICDWGLGKVLDAEDYSGDEIESLPIHPELLNDITLNGEIKGTPGYMAPEQINGDGIKSKQTDIYALGATLHHMLIGAPPHVGSNEERMHNTLHGEIIPPDLSQKEPGLWCVIQKSLSKNPELRYNSVDELRREIEKYIMGYSTSAEKAGPLRKINLFINRHRLIFSLLLGFSLVTVITSTYIWKERERTRREKKKNEKIIEMTQEALSEKKNWRVVDIVSRSKIHSHFKYFEHPKRQIFQALNIIDEALTLKAHRNLAYKAKAELLIISQRFKEAQQNLEYIHPAPSLLSKTIANYAKIQGKDAQLLHPIDLKKLVLELSENEWYFFTLERMLAYDIQQRHERDDLSNLHRRQAIQHLFLSQFWEGEPHMDHDPLSKSCRLRGKGIHHLISRHKESSGLSLLRFLDIAHLDLRDTGVSSLNELKGLHQLRTLDIRQTAISDLTPLNRLHVTKLIVAKGQFSEEQLSILEGWIEIVHQ
jgi:serine/threonine-protein kinase